MKHLASLLVLGAFAGGAFAATLNVPSQYPTIQGAINAAVDGDTVKVAAGTYFEHINWDIKNLTLRGAGIGKSVIDGGGTGRCLFLVDVPSPSRIDGFTLQNGNSDEGGGLRVLQSTIAVSNCAFTNNTSEDGGGAMFNQIVDGSVTNCTFTNNTALSTIYGLGGGAVFNQYGGPAMTNCTFTGNTADDRGGAVHNEESSPTITNCAFTNNKVTSTDGYQGGGIFNGNSSSPALTGCSFSGNVAVFGGGMRNLDGSSPTVTRCTFTGNISFNGGGGMSNGSGGTPTIKSCAFIGNTATWRGGGIENNGVSPTVSNCFFVNNFADIRGGGGMYTYNSSTTQSITNCTFTGNSTNWTGGGLRIFNMNATVTNCTFTENLSGKGLEADFGTVTLTNCILWGDAGGEIASDFGGGTFVVNNSDVQGGYAGIGNIDADPRFVNPLGHLQLQGNSPCIDAGNNAVVTTPPFLLNDSGVMIDLDGHRRISGSTVDMGAYEHSRNGGS